MGKKRMGRHEVFGTPDAGKKKGRAVRAYVKATHAGVAEKKKRKGR